MTFLCTCTYLYDYVKCIIKDKEGKVLRIGRKDKGVISLFCYVLNVYIYSCMS
jgi:hypothetical protein